MATAALIAEAWSAACDEPDWQRCGLYGPEATRILGRAVARSIGYLPSARRTTGIDRGWRPTWAIVEARAMREWVRNHLSADDAAAALRIASTDLWPHRDLVVPPAVADRLESLAGALAREARHR
jgi:hypothetical protein